jgi:hypothetical protein
MLQAPGDAYPTVMLIEPPQVLKPLRRANLQQLEAVARAAPKQPAALKVPAALRETVDRLLVRKRSSPLLTGRDASWCAGVVHAIGSANFLFDANQSPHCSAATIVDHFGVTTSTSHNHAKKVRDLLKITPFSPRWCLPSLLESSEIAWILEVDGFLRDIRSLPIEVQLQAAAKGLIPYVPALRAQPRGRA